MLAQERQQAILNILQENRSIKISDIVDRFEISTLTARRDLDVLEARKLIRRVYGGAILEEPQGAVSLRDSSPDAPTEPEREKTVRVKAIAKAAAAMVKEYDTLFMGNGNTVWEIARRLKHFSHLTVITSSLLVINELAATNNKIVVLGGILGPGEPSIHGSDVLKMLNNYCADKSFTSCMGVCAEFGVTGDFTPTVEGGRIMIEKSAHPVLVCTSSKIGYHASDVVCPVSRLEAIITDDGISEQQKEELEMAGTRVIVTSTKEKENAGNT